MIPSEITTPPSGKGVFGVAVCNAVFKTCQASVSPYPGITLAVGGATLSDVNDGLPGI